MEVALPALRQGEYFHFQAFGEPCDLYRQEIILGGQRAVTCLFPANATNFLPVAGLADVAEYTVRKIIELVSK